MSQLAQKVEGIVKDYFKRSGIKNNPGRDYERFVDYIKSVDNTVIFDGVWCSLCVEVILEEMPIVYKEIATVGQIEYFEW